MQPLKMTIQGKYWDSQVYSGKLYLFHRDATLRIIDWDQLIEGLRVPEELQLAMRCAFLRSDFLYGARWTLLFEDKEIRSLLRSKFSELAEQEIVVSEKKAAGCTLATQESPFPFPHTDTTMYMNVLYAASKSGVYMSTCPRKKRDAAVERSEKIWDCPTLSMSASYRTLALAAGDEGLFEREIDEYEGMGGIDIEPTNITVNNCAATNWLYFSTYGSSYVEDGFLANFRISEAKRPDAVEDLNPRRQRSLEDIVTAQSIFNRKGYSWGAKDKICLAIDGGVDVVRYNPWKRMGEGRLQSLGTIPLQPWKGQVVGGGIAPFGTIVECKNAVVVVPSEGRAITLPGEPVSWRVFPRSKFYENTLHIIYEDRLEIYSFNQDYFVDQTTKLSGIRVTESTRWGSGGQR